MILSNHFQKFENPNFPPAVEILLIHPVYHGNTYYCYIVARWAPIKAIRPDEDDGSDTQRFNELETEPENTYIARFRQSYNN